MAIEEFDLCIRPEPNLVIWRYMDLKKFESLLKNRALFFCRADRFSDPYEGSIPKREAKYRIKESEKIVAFFGKDFVRQKAQESINNISNLHKQFKKQRIINCWHINNAENDSMWQLYLKSNEGIAIKTTVKRLEKSFIKTKEQIFCSNVRYIDYENDIWYHETYYPFTSYNMFMPLIHKRIEFQQEQELRLIHKIDFDDYSNNYWDKQPYEKGKNICVEINDLIEEIYCAPTSDEKQIEKIKELILEYSFDFKIKRSVLSKEPYF